MSRQQLDIAKRQLEIRQLDIDRRQRLVDIDTRQLDIDTRQLEIQEADIPLMTASRAAEEVLQEGPEEAMPPWLAPGWEQPEEAVPPPRLPPGWEQRRSTAKGEAYYVCLHSMCSQWTRPTAPLQEQANSARPTNCAVGVCTAAAMEEQERAKTAAAALSAEHQAPDAAAGRQDWSFACEMNKIKAATATAALENAHKGIKPKKKHKGGGSVRGNGAGVKKRTSEKIGDYDVKWILKFKISTSDVLKRDDKRSVRWKVGDNWIEIDYKRSYENNPGFKKWFDKRKADVNLVKLARTKLGHNLHPDCKLVENTDYFIYPTDGERPDLFK
jgi:hypothetical protein